MMLLKPISMMRADTSAPAGVSFTLLNTLKDTSEAVQDYETAAFTTDGSPLFVAIHSALPFFGGTFTLGDVTIGTASRTIGTGTALTLVSSIVSGQLGDFLYRITSPGSGSQTIQFSLVGQTNTRSLIAKTYQTTGLTGAVLGTPVTNYFGNADSRTAAITTTTDGSVAFYMATGLNSTTPMSVSGATQLDSDNSGADIFEDIVTCDAYEVVPTAGANDAVFTRTPTSNAFTWMAAEFEVS